MPHCCGTDTSASSGNKMNWLYYNTHNYLSSILLLFLFVLFKNVNSCIINTKIYSSSGNALHAGRVVPCSAAKFLSRYGYNGYKLINDLVCGGYGYYRYSYMNCAKTKIGGELGYLINYIKSTYLLHSFHYMSMKSASIHLLKTLVFIVFVVYIVRQ